MAPAAEQVMPSSTTKGFSPPAPGEEIYITGIAGSYPDSRSVHELQENLFNKVDLISDDYRRWKCHDSDVPQRTGKIYDLEKFDASFFNIDYVRANVMDPAARVVQEKAYEAIVDAGYNVSELRKQRVGVFIGVALSESDSHSNYTLQDLHPYGSVSCSRSGVAVNISEWLGVDGPSYTIDTACSSSAYAIEHAVKALREGRCDVAITGGAHICQLCLVSQKFFYLGVLSKDGRCKCFDQKADGYARSEAIAVVLLQRAKHARRVYAEVIHSKTNCDGYKEHGITYPAGCIQKELLQKFYQECGVRPADVEFVEAHGTGTPVGDPEELKAIDEVFCTGRSSPLMIGSNKSNMGHTEGSSGISAISKLVIAYNSGYIPPNINFEKYREGVMGFQKGRMVVVTEKQPWSRALAACSSFGFGGANAHTLLKNVARDKVNNGLPSDDLPRLVCVSGRTKSAVAKVLDHLHSKTVDVEEVRLWHAIHENYIPGHPFRGYTLLGSTPNKSIQLARDIKNYKKIHRPVWFVYPGLGAQWPGMSTTLMKLPSFAVAVQKCQKVLKDINLVKLLTNPSIGAFENSLNSVVAMTAVQIGLSDVLKAVFVKPDNIIGHGIGHIGCAYMNCLLTAEQAIQAAYYIGQAIDNTGRLADISGQKMLKTLEHVILSPNLRQDLVYSLQNLGIFQDVVKNIPSHAVVIELTPDSQLKEKNYKFSKISLGEKNEDSLRILLAALGKLFQEGLNPALANLYPHVQFPVAQGTTMLSHLIEWDHRENWPTKVDADMTIKIHETVETVCTNEGKEKILEGHVIDGRNLFPATGYLQLVWQTLARIRGYQSHSDMSVVFENVCLNRATTIPKHGSLEFVISIHNKSGNFEVLEGDTPVVTGRVYEKKNVGACYRVISNVTEADDTDSVVLTAKDFYKELNLRGYEYRGSFRGVLDCNVTGTSGHIQWQDNWTPFLDAMLQPLIITHDTRALYVPTRIEKLCIDVDIHYDLLKKMKDRVTVYKFQSFPQVQLIRTGGVELRGLHVTAIAKKPALGIPVFEKNVFVPNYMENMCMDIKDILRSYLQLVFENVHTYKFKVIELVDQEYKSNKITPIIAEVGDILADLPLIQADLLVLSEEKMELPSDVNLAHKNISSESNTVVFIGANLFERPDVLTEAMTTLKEGCFMMSREKIPPNPVDYTKSDYDITTIHNTGFEYIVIFRKKPKSRPAKYFQLVSGDESFSWVEKLKEEITDTSNTHKIVVYSQNESVNGLLGLVNCLRREPGGESVFGLLIADRKAPAFNSESEFIKQQLSKDLAMNVFQNGTWGTYRHLLIDEPESVDAPHAYLNATTVGDLSSLRWLQGPFRADQTFKQNNLKLLHVYCSALNFRDVMTASGRVTLDAVARGRLAQECVQGLEVSGRTLNGTRVMAVTDRGICNLAKCDTSLMWCIPDEWTFEEAATVPVAYATVYMALVLIGKIRQGESILIHAGSGGVGQAAISVALHHGLEVFTTVGTASKRTFIKKLFPQLKESHIGNSRDTSFEDMIRRETSGKGVNLVLNSLADDKLQASVKCLTRRGRFLEIGKYDITNNTRIETYLFRNEISFHGVMLDFIGDVQSQTLRQNLQKLLMVGITSGAVRPLTCCTFGKDEIESAYRYMAAGKHIGKVIIKIRDGELQSNKPVRPVAAPIKALPRYTCDEDHVYILLGGLGGFGLELADWLVLRGARKLVLCSRKGVSNGYQALRIRIWQTYGVVVHISTDDITTEEGCDAMLTRAKNLGPVAAVFNLAVVLRDAIFQNQTQQSFKESYGPKALATIHLDKLTRKLCPELKDFVIFSSVSCGRGNAGQTNYGFSNSVMERICEIRKNDGLPALAIQWGAIGDVGLVADMQEENIQLEIGGTLQQRIVSCLQAMDMFLKQDAAIVSSIVVAEKKSSGATSGSSVDAIAAIMGIKDMKTVSHQASLAELGMDSIMAVEIKQTLERDYELFLSAQEIRNLSFAKLVQYTSKEESQETPTLDAKESKTKTETNNISFIIKNLGDEKHAANTSMWLPTLVSNSPQRKAETIFMMSGIENCASALKILCSRLDSRACVLQLGVRNNDEKLDQMVDRLYPIVKSHLCPGEQFHILGYSFGALVMLQIASKLEKDGHNGQVICLDGSPEYIKKSVASVMGHVDDDDTFQNRLLEKLTRRVFPSNALQNHLMEELTKCKTFEEKIDATLTLYRDVDGESMDYSREYREAIILALYNRMKIALDSPRNINIRLKAPITLIRSKSSPLNVECSEDYGLSAFSEHRVVIHYLDDTHANIVDSEECAAIVNMLVKNVEAITDSNKNKTSVVKNLLGQNIRTLEM